MKKISSVVIIIIFSVIRLHAQCDISGTLSVCVGSTTQLLGTGTPATIDPWISASPDVATVNGSGLVAGVKAGTSIITYTSTSCSSIVTVTVTDLVTPLFTALGPYCVGATPDALPTISANGISGTWSPATIGTASAGIAAYTFTPTAGQCASTTTMTINITPNTTPAFDGVGPYCSGATVPALPTTSTNGITGTWSPVINNTASTLYTFTPSAGQCATTTTMTINITPNTTPVFDGVGPYCSAATVLALPTTSTNGITGTWSPAINNSVTTLYTFTPTEGQCAATTTLTITIIPSTIPAFTGVGPYCSGATIPELPTTSTNEINGTWSPAINNSATTLYTFTPTEGQCAATTTLTITIIPNTIPAFSGVGPYCSGATIPALPTTSTNGIDGTWSPSINNSATTLYTFTPTGGQCATSTTLTVTIITSPTAPVVGTVIQPTCGLASGSVILSGLPASGTWTLTRSPGGTATTGTGTSTTVTGIPSGTYTYTVTYATGCISPPSASVVINTNPSTPTPPSVGAITQPACSVATGSVVLGGLPSTGTWTLTRAPGGITYSSTGISYTLSALATGTYTFTVTNESGCTSAASANVVINSQPTTPTAPAVGTITQPTCSAAGSVVLNGLPATGTWTLTRTPGGTTNTGTGTSTSVSGLAAGIYTFTVTNASGCISSASGNVVINSQPPTPSAPIVGTITDPTCTLATSSIDLGGLPSSGTWTITRTPGNTTSTGTGTSTTLSGIPAGTYTFTVTNASGCTSTASVNAVIDAQPSTPNAPVAGTITHPTCTVATGSILINGLPSSGSWTLTRNPGGTTVTGTGTSTTISGLAAGTYTFTVTNSSGCTSTSSANMVINTPPVTPAAPSVGTITHPTCQIGTGSVILNGLPPSGTWTITRTPGGATTSGTGTSTTIAGLAADTYRFTVINSSGCISSSSASAVINANPLTPTAPAVGTIIQPTCTSSTGGVVLNGLPSSGTWTLERTPGNVTTTGTGSSTTISGLSSNTYTFTVTIESGCTSTSSGNVVINEQPTTPNAPAAGTIIQPTCTVATGSVVLNGLPGTGTWTLTRTPGGTTNTGSGTSTTISGLSTGTYSFTVTNISGCTSPGSANIVINTQPSTPTAPTVGTIIHPTCAVSTGSAVLNGLPAAGTWTLTGTPGGITITGTGTSATISGIPAGSLNFTVTNALGCVSSASGNALINAQPPTPTAPIIGTITQPSLSVPTGRVVLSGLPASGAWTLTATPGGIITAGTGLSTTISGLAPGIYTFTVTNASGCTSRASAAVGLFTLKLYGPDQKILRSNDTVNTGNSDAGSISISVESNTEWTVSENSLWLKAVKESGSSKITVFYLENISSVNKVAAIKVAYKSNPEMVINFKQKARVSQLSESKFDYIKVYPNPANDYVNLNFGKGEFEKVIIAVTNIQGFIMSMEEYSNITSGQIIGLNISVLPVGQYLISVRDGIYTKSFRIIKY